MDHDSCRISRPRSATFRKAMRRPAAEAGRYISCSQDNPKTKRGETEEEDSSFCGGGCD